MEIAKITSDQVRRILASDEDHFLDLKSIDIAPAKLTRTISAFSNASGGELYIGIDEINTKGTKRRLWRGFDDIEAANGYIQVFEQLFPLGTYYDYSFLKVDTEQGFIFKVSINKTREITKASDGVVYLRRGAQNLPITSEAALQRLKLDKGVTSFEQETLDVAKEVVSNSIPLLEFLVNVIPTAEPSLSVFVGRAEGLHTFCPVFFLPSPARTISASTRSRVDH
jgi:ATP-dependent DNA helicase RecG